MNKLIIIAGMPRSGTSWVGKIFDSHPDTAYRAEPDNGKQLSAIPRFPRCDTPNSELITEFALSLSKLNHYRITAKPPNFNKSYRNGFSNLVFRSSASLARLGSQLNLNMPVLGARVESAAPQPVMVWKTVRSLGRSGLILQTLTQAKLVHLLRHPCGYIASVLRGMSANQFAADTDKHYGVFQQLLKSEHVKGYSLTIDKLKSLNSEQRLAWLWLLVNEKALNDCQRHDTRSYLVRYEDICANPASEVRELFAFSGLNWSLQTEAFLTRSTSIQKNRYYTVFKDPHQAANRWRDELDPKAIDEIMAVVANNKVLANLYPPDSS